MARLFALLAAAIAFPAAALADGYTPEEAVKRMKLPEGFSVRVVASEAMIRQPVSVSFDAQGRMWVLQYLQYPNYAGLKPVKQDQYLRTIWDKVPEPPPHGPKGLDRITICSDPDENGVYRKSKDFVTGLNIASGFCLGNGGVYVVQPPYLLFYPDKNEDDVPDGDPEVLLSGFGMDDTHSLANSLQWGPDGWLYGAAGSTSTCKIANPANPKEIIEFQQGIWRYHPKTKRFELFSEGGGNTYGLDFDKHGQVIAGTNYGGFACLHQMQGAYYVKGFAKHGPLHNPHTYGYFEHVPYTGFKGGHVTCGGIVYQADAYPEEYRDQYIAANLLSNVINWHHLEPYKSSFKAGHGGTLLEGNDPWFRPIDCLLGPDGSVYVVDFYDRRAAHLDPVDNWDKTNGRVYKIEYKGTPKVPAFDLRKKTSAELVQLLKHPNKWWRNEARRLLAERRDKSIYTTLRNWLVFEKGDLALEAFWALATSGGWTEQDFANVRQHPNEYVRAWMIRYFGDEGARVDSIYTALQEIARTETSAVVLAQLACTAKRFEPQRCMDVMSAMLENPVAGDDSQLPLLMWWAMESANTRDTTDTVRFPFPQPPNQGLCNFFGERVARRFLAGDLKSGPARFSTLIDLTLVTAQADMAAVLKGAATALQAHPLDAVPPPLQGRFAVLKKMRPNDLLLLEVLARMNDGDARKTLLDIAADTKVKQADRLKAIDLLRQVREPKAREFFLSQVAASGPDAMKIGFLGGLEAFDDAAIGQAVLGQYPKWSAAVKKRAIQLLLSRPSWALTLLKEFDADKFPKADLTLDHAKAAVGLEDKAVTALVEKHFGKLAPATAGEKRARITWLDRELKVGGPGDPLKGKALFAKHCAACHTLHGEGGKVGPDLTTADRKNRGYLLANVVDPSGYIRPEFVVQNVTTLDGRKVSGIVEPGSGESITLVNVVNDKPEKATVAKADIEDIRPSAVSLMPEKLLDTLSYAEIIDLFAYLTSDAPLKGEIRNPKSEIRNKSEIGNQKSEIGNKRGQEKKLRVCMVSGSFEYKSDASLAAFKKYLEEKYPVECTLVAAKSDKDLNFPGLEKLDNCDIAIFFTRRLQIEGESLERVKKYVKSGKPIVGIRTASHGFQKWLEMDKEVLGGDYQGHFGHDLPCEVSIAPKAKDHPVLRGVKPFKAIGGLYKNPKVAADVTVLLIGSIPKESEQPVAWVREKDGRRVFYTSLGHPEDFKNEAFLRLLVNGLSWASKSELMSPR